MTRKNLGAFEQKNHFSPEKVTYVSLAPSHSIIDLFFSLFFFLGGGVLILSWVLIQAFTVLINIRQFPLYT